MRIAARRLDEVTLLTVEGKVVHPETAALRSSVRKALESGSPNLLLDLSGVTGIDSAGIGELAAALLSTARRGGTLKLLNPSRKPFDVLQISGLLRTFEIFHDESEAIASFESELVGAAAD